MFINFTNHPSAQWSAEQKAAAQAYGEVIDLARFGELGKQGVLALLADSTNVERPGYTMSERTVGRTFNRLFQGCKQRIIVTTFASNVHRIQQILSLIHISEPTRPY